MSEIDITFNRIYIFQRKDKPKIVLMKVKRKKERPFQKLSRYSIRIEVQNYIMKKEKKGWKKITMEKFNTLGLAYVGQYYSGKKA